MFQRARAAACLSVRVHRRVPMIAAIPASAQGHTIRQGMLTCRTSASVGLVVGSRQRLRLPGSDRRPAGPREILGTIGRLGLDLGVTAGGVMAWVVLASTPHRFPRAHWPASSSGASGDISLGVGVGANLLVGGTRRSPVSLLAAVGPGTSPASISRSAWRG